MSDFSLQYLIWVFFASVGVLQIAAAFNGLRGIQLSNNRRLNLFVGAACILGSYVWFFSSAQRNTDGWKSGVEGLEQAILFLAGSAGAALFTFAITSIIHRSRVSNTSRDESGIDALRTRTVWQALRSNAMRERALKATR